MKAILGPFVRYATYLAFILALVAMGLSLYLSEVQHLALCLLCWWQRICMYPLVVILGIGLVRRDRNVYLYALPLAAAGALIALYHSLLQWQIIPEAFAPCQAGISCSNVQLEYLHFITIPFASLVTFVAIVGLLLLSRRQTAV